LTAALVGLGLAFATVPATAQPVSSIVEDPPSPPEGLDCRPHAPIHVEGDQGPTGFALGEAPTTGEPVHRPGSGVVDGSGTPEDPYVIEGWCILAPAGVPAIAIAETNAHVEIRDNHVLGQDVEQPQPPEEGPDRVPEPERPIAVGSVGIHLDGADNVAVRGNAVTDQRSHGLVAEDVASLRLADNRLAANDGDAVRIDGGQRVALAGNDVEANADCGVCANDTRQLTVEDATVEANGGPGIDLQNVQTVDVRASTVSANAVGIHVDDGRALEVSGNTVEDNEAAGVHLQAADDVTVQDNTIDANGECGICLQGVDAAEVRDNELADNGADGVDVRASTQVIVAANTITGSGDDGIGSGLSPEERVEQVTIVGNTVETSYASQIGLSYAHGLTVEANTVHDGGWIGIRLSNGLSNVTVHGNTVTDNRFWGVPIWSGDNVTVTENRIQANGNDALRLSDLTDVEVAQNTIRANEGIGIDVDGLTRVAVDANLVRDNEAGIAVADSSQASLAGNDVEANAELALYATELDEPLDARENRWGHDTGPSGGQPDACSEAIADGEGAALLVGPPPTEADVCFAPWLETPNPDAGAG
jgi:parallel beta-helix repeat protein